MSNYKLTGLCAGGLAESVDGVKPGSMGHQLPQLTNERARTRQEAR